MKHIVLTGGGTAGHVTPNIALIPQLEKEGYKITYIGSHTGIEKELITALNIPYYSISSGKLRRYVNIKNFTDAFRVVKGMGDALLLLRKLKPDIVFSKGGFVSVPVVIAAAMLRIPVIIHESDITPGLANKFSVPFASAVCASFPEALEHIPKEKAHLTGSPIRPILFEGDKKKGLDFCMFDDKKPVLLVMGGSLGSVKINTALRNNIDKLLEDFQIVHLCGKGNLDMSLSSKKGYRQFEYLSFELPDIIAAADIIVSRAGANSIFEFLALKKPTLLIPLPLSASRGDQILNAASFEKQGFSKVLAEENITDKTFISAVSSLYTDREKYISAMKKEASLDSVKVITDLIRSYIH
ncbi:MAG: undecaprenyldiphospho-muramoylpentapeptide beta-N-acetylglucosaminyltransferase [Firmicutes bacterium]|nr:undecaprenyldiphospho-muramoylpentapeptide beta-N-acetylglucosaminyltransferase [Bacillota bacterium]